MKCQKVVKSKCLRIEKSKNRNVIGTKFPKIEMTFNEKSRFRKKISTTYSKDVITFGEKSIG